MGVTINYLLLIVNGQQLFKKGGGALRSEFVIIHTKILIPTKNVEKIEGGALRAEFK